jgi:hypothetical protein
LVKSFGEKIEQAPRRDIVCVRCRIEAHAGEYNSERGGTIDHLMWWLVKGPYMVFAYAQVETLP